MACAPSVPRCDLSILRLPQAVIQTDRGLFSFCSGLVPSPMAFQNANHIDARDSIINDVRGNQFNIGQLRQGNNPSMK